MSDNKIPSTRELIAQAESLRGGETKKAPKTRQLVREAESLIGRENAQPKVSRLWLFLMLLALAGGGVFVYVLFGT